MRAEVVDLPILMGPSLMSDSARQTVGVLDRAIRCTKPSHFFLLRLGFDLAITTDDNVNREGVEPAKGGVLLYFRWSGETLRA